MKNIVVTAEAVGLLVSAILIYAGLFETKRKNKKEFAFVGFVGGNAVVTFVDMMSWLLEGKQEYGTVAYFCNLLSMVLSFILVILLMTYLYFYISERYRISSILFNIPCALAILCSVVTYFTSSTGLIFTIVDGIFQEGPYYSVYLMVNILLILYILVPLIVYFRYLGLHDFFATLSYIVFPMVCMVINLKFPGLALTYVGTVLAVLLMYVMLQSEHETTLIRRDKEVSHWASHDELTGLLNRTAFSAVIEQMNGTEPLGIIFCDVNGLKYTNDNQGHAAGDKLLKDVAHVLLTYFRRQDVYRISGDEFVVVLPNVSDEILDVRVRLLRLKLEADNFPLASAGAAHGIAKDAEKILQAAEAQMYEEKEKFYSYYPKYVRH